MYLHNKEQARRRAFKARAAEQNRTLPRYIQSGLETDSYDAEQRLGETYAALRMSNQSIANLTGMNVEDFLKVSAVPNPIKVFKSLRAGKGPAGEISNTQLGSLETIEKLVVTYQKLAHETVEAKEVAAEYADERARLAQLDKTPTIPGTDVDTEYATRVRTAQKRLITATGSVEELQGLWERLDRSQTYKQTDEIYREISKRYGAEVQEAFRVVDVARQRLQAASEAGREISNAYTEAATARAELTQEERQGVQVKEEAVQVGDKQAAAERVLAGAQTAQGQATKANAQAEAEQRAGRQDLAAQSRNLEKQTLAQTAAIDAQVRTTETLTKETLAAGEQMAATTRRVEDGAAAHSGLTQALRVHQERVTPLTEAYRELSVQIGETVGDLLTGEVSFKEAWESLSRGVLETVRNLGRQMVDSLLGDVRDLGRGLSDVIFGQLRGMLGSFGFGGSRGFLPSFLAGGSPGGLPVGFPTFPTGGGFSFGGFPVGGGSPLWNAGAATVARYLPFTAPTLVSYGFTVSPVGLGTGASGGVPGVTAPPAAGVGPFSPAALGALGGLGGGYGGTALLGALGFQPGLTSTIGGFAGGIAGSLATPALTALLAPALGPLAPLVGPLFGTFFGTTLGGLFGFQPTRIDTEKRGLRDWFRDVAPGFDYQRKEGRVASGLGRARAAGLDVENAYLVAGLPYALQADDAGLGTLTRYRNIGVAGLGRSGASRATARKTALRIAGKSGVDTTAGAVGYLNRALGGGFDRDSFTVSEVLENRDENAGEPRHSRTRIVRLRDVVAGIIDIQTEFAGFVDSSRLAARILADETEQALRTAGRDASDYADVISRIRDGSTHAAEALREIGGLDFADLTFTAAEFDAHLLRIKDDVEGITAAARTALTTGFQEGHTRAQVEQTFKDTVDDAIKNAFIKRTIDAALDLDSLFEGIDLTDPATVGGDTLNTIRTRIGAGYQSALDILAAAGLTPAGVPDAQDPDALAAAAAVRRNRREQRLEAVGALAPGTAGINLLNTEIETLRRDVGALALPTADASAESLRTALGLIEQLADKTVAYYQTAIAEQQTLFTAYETTADSLDRRVQGLIGAPGGLSRTEQLASLQARAQSTREELAGLTGTDRAAALDRLGANLDAQIRLGAYAAGDPRQRRLFSRNLAEIEDLREDADKHARTAEQAIEDLQGAVVSEINNLHDLSDQYFKTSIGKFSEIADLIRGYETADGLGPIDPPAPRRRPAATPPPEAAAATSASVLPEKGGRRGSSPAVTINVTLPESAGASDEAADYARAFVAELERQLQPGARGYELIHTISRES